MQSKTSSHSVHNSVDLPVLKEAIKIQSASRERPHTKVLSALIQYQTEKIEFHEIITADVLEHHFLIVSYNICMVRCSELPLTVTPCDGDATD